MHPTLITVIMAALCLAGIAAAMGDLIDAGFNLAAALIAGGGSHLIRQNQTRK